MKKFIVLFIVLLPAVNFTAGAHSGCGGRCGGRGGGFGDKGFTAGLEFGIEGVNKDSRMPAPKGIAGFGHSFLDGALDIYLELNYTVGFPKRHNDLSSSRSVSRCLECDDDPSNGHFGDPSDDDWALRQSLYSNSMIGYNLNLGFDGETVLSFILQNEIDELTISPRSDNSNNIRGIFTPAIRFSHEFNTGDIYTQIGVPFTYVRETKNADKEVGLEFTLGWNSLLGLELEAMVYTLLAPGSRAGFDALAFLIGYELKQFHFSVDTYIPLREIDRLGVNITPQIEYTFRQWTFHANCIFYHIGSGLYVTPALGFKYTFLRR